MFQVSFRPIPDEPFWAANSNEAAATYSVIGVQL